jgi:hypothetical protein
MSTYNPKYAPNSAAKIIDSNPNNAPNAGTAGKPSTGSASAPVNKNNTTQPSNKARGANAAVKAGTAGKKKMNFKLHMILAKARATRLLRLGKITQAQYKQVVNAVHPKGQAPITGTGYNQQQPITKGASPVKSMGAK